MRRPLLLTGGPAVGKSSTGRALAELHDPCAFIDVDDVRQLVVGGHRAPWDGSDGVAQQQLGIANTCALAANFAVAGIDTVMADVVTPATLSAYRSGLAGLFVVRLRVPIAEARRRAKTRPVFLTAAEFDALHSADRTHPPAADAVLDVAGMSLAQQVAAVDDLWASASRS
jgi:predicted kinase